MSNVKFTRWYTILLVLAIMIAMLFFGIMCTNPTMRVFFVGQISRDAKTDIYAIQNETAPKRATVFLGDSITEMYDIKHHYTKSEGTFLNRGISTDTTDGVLKRLVSNVMSANPRKIVLLIGTNDLNNGLSPDEIADNILKIARHILDFDDTVELYVESVYPVNKSIPVLSDFIVKGRTNGDIDNINKTIEEFAPIIGYTYLDINSLLKDKKGELNKAYTMDGLHLSKNGYKVLTRELKKHIL